MHLALPMSFVLAASGAAQSLHVVDASGGPGSDFTSIAGAVAAAADGDTLLVRSGLYGAVVIDDRALTIAADTAASVELVGSLAVANLAAGKDLTLAGLTMRTQAVGPSFTATRCAGTVLVQDCEIRIQQTGTVSTGDVARVTDCENVVFTRCDLIGALPLIPFVNGDCLDVANSSVALYDSTLTGPIGQPGNGFRGEPGGVGGAGVRLQSGNVFVSGSTVTGGQGGEGTFPGPFGAGVCTDGGPGGPGLEMVGGPTVVRLDTVFEGGPAGVALDDDCEDGLPGASTSGEGGVTSLSAAARSFSAVSPIRHAEAFSSTATGAEGDLVLALLAHELAPTPFLVETNGPLWPGLATAELFFLGVVPASGELDFSFTVQFAQTAKEFLIQALFFDRVDGFVLSNPQSVLFLGAGV